MEDEAEVDFGEADLIHIECWTGSDHVVLNKDSTLFHQDLPVIIDGYMDEKALVELMVIDPPYGLNKASWDGKEEAQEWAQTLIPKIVASLKDVGENFLSPTFKIAIFHHMDSDYLWVCIFVFFFLPLKDIQKYFKEAGDWFSKTIIWIKDTIKSSKSEFVNNGEVIWLVAQDQQALKPQMEEFPFNSKCINVRPSKKWKNQDGVFILVLSQLTESGSHQSSSKAQKVVGPLVGYFGSKTRYPNLCSCGVGYDLGVWKSDRVLRRSWNIFYRVRTRFHPSQRIRHLHPQIFLQVWFPRTQPRKGKRPRGTDESKCPFPPDLCKSC